MGTSKRTHTQWDFTGGAISSRMLMRADTEVYQKSVLWMENFIPTRQGSAERAPGSRFVYDTGFTNVRIIPYLSPANDKAFVEIAAGSCKIQANITDNLNNPGVLGSPDPTNTIGIRKQIVQNAEFRQSADPWVMDPEEYTSGGDTLGLKQTNAFGGNINGVSRNAKSGDIDTCTISTTAEVDFATDRITADFRLLYLNNFSGDNAEYEAKIRIGTTPGGFDVLDYNFTGIAGTIRDLVQNRVLPTPAWTGTLYLTVYWKSLNSPGNPHNSSTPLFRLERFNIFADDEIEIGSTAVFGTVPWLDSQIEDIHFIQSPYGAPAGDVTKPAKELVLTHPAHRPYELFFNTDPNRTTPEYPTPGDIPLGYVLLRKVFTNQPATWGVGNWPATCGSLKGRLFLAGSLDDPLIGAPTAPETETTWGTEVGNWNAFTAPGGTVTANDSIEFATIYRSAIKWIYGQKTLLIGAAEMEYSASADGIFQPADIGVDMHTTHGSAGVQPVGLGKSVAFAADGGRKVREMMFQNEDQGWVAPDLTLLNPEITATGVIRMVRMRNPHQMVVCLTSNGRIALLHHDAQAGVAGWSSLAITPGKKIVDICVVADSNGVDILYAAVRRRVDGVDKLYIEAIVNWVDTLEWDYMASATLFLPETPTNIITGLDHLEGIRAQVIGDRNFLGSFLVTGGTVTLTDQVGNDIDVASALVGRAMTCALRLLPPAALDPGSSKKYKNVNLRIRNSTRPFVNNVRPPEREPLRIMGNSQDLEEFEDIQVMDLDWTLYETVNIWENIPLRVEILGVYGDLTESSV